MKFVKMTPEQRKEWLKTKSSWNKGIPRTEKDKYNISIHSKGKIVSSETRKKISLAHKGKYFGGGFKKGHISKFKGVPRTQEIRLKISNSLKGHTAWNKGLNKDNNIKIRQASEKRKGNKWIFKKDDKHIKWKGGTGSYYHRKSRELMEKYIGRKLSYDEVVHHIDGNQKNNAINNLKLMSRAEHSRYHMKKIRNMQFTLNKYIKEVIKND